MTMTIQHASVAPPASGATNQLLLSPPSSSIGMTPRSVFPPSKASAAVAVGVDGGCVVGAVVGKPPVGPLVGVPVGSAVGSSVGEVVGTIEAEGPGEGAWDAVGDAVGADDALGA